MTKTVPDIIFSFKSRKKKALTYKTGFRTFVTSYKDLYKNVLKTYSFLESLKLQKKDRIVLWGFNSSYWATIFLACALKGVIVVPIDYALNSEFVEKIAKITHAKVIFHSEFKLLTNNKTKSYIIEYLDKYIEYLEPTKRFERIKEKDILEVVYTSGTTGDPKGVIVTHKNIISNISSILKTISIKPNQNFLSLLPLSHLLEQNIDFLAPLLCGCTITYIRTLKPSLIFEVIKDEKITNLVTVPRILMLLRDSVLREAEERNRMMIFKLFLKMKTPKIIKKILFNEIHKKFGEDFLYFVVGGAPLPYDLQLFWERLGFTVIQGYGLTECSPVLTANNLEKQVLGSVGRIVPGVKIKIDKDGEILAQGENVTSGYYLNKEKTNKLFSGKWMRTGDIGYFDKSGYLFLKDRKKDVIVTSAGVNVYPQDVETILRENKNLKDVCVVGLPTTDGEKVHVEFLLKAKVDIKEIIEEANRKLNDSQKITSYAVWERDDFPRTATQKIRKSLVREEILSKQGKISLSAFPSKPKVYEILAKVCKVDMNIIRPSSKLSLDLGLTSINRVELTSILEQEFNTEINEDEITTKTTAKQLDELVKNRNKDSSKINFRKWQLSKPMVLVRMTFNYLIVDNLIRVFCKRIIIGKENFKNLKTPAIFISNHVGYFDAPNVLMSLPLEIRAKISPAAKKEYFEVPKNGILKKPLLNFYYQYASLFMNIYLFPKEKGFKRSLEYTGWLLDKGWNILFFPEGKHSKSGQLEDFKSGIGWLVKEMRVPVVPIKHFGLEKIMHGDKQKFPKFGKVIVKIGKPIELDYTKSSQEITSQIYLTLKAM